MLLFIQHICIGIESRKKTWNFIPVCSGELLADRAFDLATTRAYDAVV